MTHSNKINRVCQNNENTSSFILLTATSRDNLNLLSIMVDMMDWETTIRDQNHITAFACCLGTILMYWKTVLGSEDQSVLSPRLWLTKSLRVPIVPRCLKRSPNTSLSSNSVLSCRHESLIQHEINISKE